MELTENEAKILKFIEKYNKEIGISPSFQEISYATKLSSYETISRLVNNLEKKNKITILRKNGKMIKRGLILNDNNQIQKKSK